MPLKKGAGGRAQNYDPHTGRYASTHYQPPPLTKREKAQKRLEAHLKNLYDIIIKKDDPLVAEVFTILAKEIPHHIIHANHKTNDDIHHKDREFDIITQRCLVEIKSGKARRCLTQLLEQKEYACSNHKKHILFAPDISKGTKRAYENQGITIVRTTEQLISFVKENDK